MPRRSQVLVWALVAAAAALFGFFVAVLAGAIPIDPPAQPAESGAAPARQTVTAEETASTTVTKRNRGTTAPLAVVVTAARGDSWISARLGSKSGRVLEERLLARGESVRFSGARVWLSVGAAANIDVTVNGEEHALQPGTVSVVLGPA